jgi:plasmid stabilization system protein ParE
MSQNQRPVVAKVIEAFKSRLSDSALAQITDAQFSDLASLIDEAIADEVAAAADLVDELARKLRASARKPELGL